ncbi:MAG: DUF2752 domain-containing protein [Chitinophagales bacterium]|nr:DUF2752 domain-containing protein [Chitinophagales bacterium]MDW8274169.1 DUF2752 domain-containing protein [Chitinophagales bacterium]
MISINFTKKINCFPGSALLLLTFVAVLLGPLFVMLANPGFETSPTVCLAKSLTGLPCPGCGITRSIIFFYKGDVIKSLSYHLFGIPTVFFCIAALAAWALPAQNIFAIYFRKILFSKSLALFLAIFLTAYHIIRLFSFIHSHSLSEILDSTIWK